MELFFHRLSCVLSNNIVDFTCGIFQVQDNGAYNLGLDETPDVIGLCFVHFF